MISLVFSFMVALGLILCTGGTLQASDNGVRVIVVVANHLSLDDFRTAGPSLRKLVQRGAVALVNTGLGGAVFPKYMSLGAGLRLNGPGGTPDFYDADEPLGVRTAREAYLLQTGLNPPKGSIICVGFPRIWRSNSSPLIKVDSLGMLGDVFHNNHLKTAVVGNSDVPNELVRGAPLIAMDNRGEIDAGSVGSAVVMSDPDSPAGCRDNLDAITKLATASMQNCALVVVELGDFNRIESYRYQMSDSAYKLYRARALQSLDNFIHRIRPEVEKHDAALIICSPSPERSKSFFSDLTPMLLYKPGQGGGLITSGTTRCRGLISNIDVGPTILRFAGLGVPRSVLGEPATIVASANPMGRLFRIERIASRNYGLQIPILATIGALAILLITLAELSIRFNKRQSVRKVLSVALLAVVLFPTAFLLIDGLGGNGLASYFFRFAAAVVVLLGVSLLIGRLAFRTGKANNYAPLAIAQVLTVIILVADGMVGNPLLRWSILSCDHITGIRYYGIGNEYMGVMIGAALIGATLLLRGKWNNAGGHRTSGLVMMLLLIWFTLVAFMIGYPGLGANAGGLITAVATFGVAVIAISGNKLNRRHVISLAALVIGAIVICAVIDMLGLAGKGSHLGRTLALASVYGWGYLLTLVTGKLGMHLHIIETRQAYLPALASIPFLLMYRLRIRTEKPAQPWDIMLRAAMPATITGVVVGFLFNDSGIVPAAFIFSQFMVTMLYLRLQGDEPCV